MFALCGNANHPDGPWHEAAPLPASWQLWARFQGWLNRERWDCRCPKGGGSHDQQGMGLVAEEGGAGGTADHREGSE